MLVPHIGEKWHRLKAVAISSHGYNTDCVCDCGAEITIATEDFRFKKSCGCLKAYNHSAAGIYRSRIRSKIESWKTVKGWPEYAVSNHGNVGRISHGLLKPRANDNGYLTVVLCARGKKKHKLVHHLVLFSFIGKRPEGYEANHKDGRKNNNCDWNLEWVTPERNREHWQELMDMITKRAQTIRAAGLEGEDLKLYGKVIWDFQNRWFFAGQLNTRKAALANLVTKGLLLRIAGEAGISKTMYGLPGVTPPEIKRRQLKTIIEMDGESKTVSEWAEIYKISHHTIRLRLRRWWDPVKAVTTPPMKGAGSEHGQAILDDNDVISIRLRNKESVTRLAREFGVAPRTIRCVINRETWKHVPNRWTRILRKTLRKLRGK